MSGITAIHHPLRNVKAGSCKIRPIIHVDHSADGSAMNSHAQLQERMFLERPGDFDRAPRGPFRAGVKDQGHTIAGRDLQ